MVDRLRGFSPPWQGGCGQEEMCMMVTRRDGEGGLWSFSFLHFILFGPPTGISDSTAQLQGGSPLFLLPTPPHRHTAHRREAFPGLLVACLSVQVDGQS